MDSKLTELEKIIQHCHLAAAVQSEHPRRPYSKWKLFASSLDKACKIIAEIKSNPQPAQGGQE